jgi:hypothetical protein
MSKDRVLDLYRSIRRLHRRLPPGLGFLGNQYVRDEFGRHKTAGPEFLPGFLDAWTEYRDSLSAQLSADKKSLTDKTLGAPLSNLESLSEAQLGQLYALRQAAKGESLSEDSSLSGKPR